MLVRCALIALAFGACGNACPDPAPGYATDIAPVLARSCLGCHAIAVRGANRQGAPLEANYETQEGAAAFADDISLRASGGGPRPMPPVTSSLPKLSSAEKTALTDWANCGTNP